MEKNFINYVSTLGKENNEINQNIWQKPAERLLKLKKKHAQKQLEKCKQTLFSICHI